jgi:hypothetical protein
LCSTHDFEEFLQKIPGDFHQVYMQEKNIGQQLELSLFSTYCMRIWFIGVTSCKDDRDGRQNKRERSTNHRRQSGTEETLQKGVDSSHKQQCLDDNCLVLLAKEETPLVNNKRILSKATELSRLVILHCFLPSAERVQ